MFIDLRDVADPVAIEADVCIIGAGAAGITIARELSGSRIRVALLESGGLEFEPDSQDLFEGELARDNYGPLSAERLRFFGGTTNHWDGFCRPLDPIDFERRPYITGTGWPLGSDEMTPFFERAQVICQLGPLQYSGEPWGAPDGFDTQLMHTAVFQCSPPTRFGEVYREDIARSKNVTCYLHATAVSCLGEGDSVKAITFRSLGGRDHTLTAKAYVLACGGIENARVLLNWGFDRFSGAVGRYFMDHPTVFKSANVVFAETDESFRFWDYIYVRGTKICGCLLPTADTLEREQLWNCSFFLSPATVVDQSPGAASIREIVRDAVRNHTVPDHLGRHVVRILGDMNSIVGGIYRRGLVGKDSTMYSVRHSTEVQPNPDSRVTLVADTDPLGMRRCRLDWRLPSDYVDQFKRSHDLFARQLGASGIGRMQFNPVTGGLDGAPDRYEQSHHQMGTTRMGSSPATSVVDGDCLVHGLNNFYVAGSSVFPTYGFANPTVNIVALACRLADHLKSEMPI